MYSHAVPMYLTQNFQQIILWFLLLFLRQEKMKYSPALKTWKKYVQHNQAPNELAGHCFWHYHYLSLRSCHAKFRYFTLLSHEGSPEYWKDNGFKPADNRWTMVEKYCTSLDGGQTWVAASLPTQWQWSPQPRYHTSGHSHLFSPQPLPQEPSCKQEINIQQG